MTSQLKLGIAAAVFAGLGTLAAPGAQADDADVQRAVLANMAFASVAEMPGYDALNHWQKGVMDRGFTRAAQDGHILLRCEYEGMPEGFAPRQYFWLKETPEQFAPSRLSDWHLALKVKAPVGGCPDAILFDGENARFSEETVAPRSVPDWGIAPPVPDVERAFLMSSARKETRDAMDILYPMSEPLPAGQKQRVREDFNRAWFEGYDILICKYEGFSDRSNVNKIFWAESVPPFLRPANLPEWHPAKDFGAEPTSRCPREVYVTPTEVLTSPPAP